VSGHAKMPPASHQVSATSLKLLIQQIHPHVRVERDSGMCVARDLYEALSQLQNALRILKRAERVRARHHARSLGGELGLTALQVVSHHGFEPI
jgi:hypothetical protein